MFQSFKEVTIELNRFSHRLLKKWEKDWKGKKTVTRVWPKKLDNEFIATFILPTNNQNILCITSIAVGYSLITYTIVLCIFLAQTHLLLVLLLHFSPSIPDPFPTELRYGYPLITTVIANPLSLFELIRVRYASR